MFSCPESRDRCNGCPHWIEDYAKGGYVWFCDAKKIGGEIDCNGDFTELHSLQERLQVVPDGDGAVSRDV